MNASMINVKPGMRYITALKMIRGQIKMNEIDQAAIMWNKTKDPKYRDLWYKLIKEYVERYL
jgi:hypothetical protein